MNHRFFRLTLLLTLASHSLGAASIEFGGYLLNRADWRDTSAPKLEPRIGNKDLDLDGDGALGTDGYVLFGPAGQEGGKVTVADDWQTVALTHLPSYISKAEILTPAEMGRFPGYASLAHPEEKGLNFTSGALIVSAEKDVRTPLLKFTFGEHAPEAVRIGLMVDHLDNGNYNARSFSAQSGAQEVGPIVTLVQSGSANGVPDFYFFELSDIHPGDSVVFSGESGPAGLITLGALTFDSVSSAYYSEFRHPDRYLKDFFVYKDNATYHLFYNIGLADGKQEWQLPGNEEMFGHATSTDLKHWEYHPGVLITQPLTWEEATVSAPSIIKRADGVYYMAYTGFDREANQRMGLATSKDLFHWERYAGNPLPIEPAWTSWKPKGWADFRDPHLLPMPDGYTYLFNTVHVPNVGGAVALARSKDLIKWEDLGKERAIYPGFHPAESAHAFTRNGKVYVFIGGGGNALMVTDDILSGKWEKVDFKWPRMGLWSGWETFKGPDGKLMFCAFQWKMHGNFIRFWEVDWDGDVPRLKQ